MIFVHQARDFVSLLRLVERDTGIAAALIEKDYWITHCLWALHQTGLDIWFKGGTSLSKGFSLIERFSEDLDLMIQAGSCRALPLVSSWTSASNGPVSKRRSFYRALGSILVIPSVDVSLDETRRDKLARTADYLARYPVSSVGPLPQAVSPFVRLEVGCARVVPFVEMPLTSFVHEYLIGNGMADPFLDNRPYAVRCVHPLVTLLEKLDAIARRYMREDIEADSFVRHYEDAARIVLAADLLPVTTMSASALAYDMVSHKDIAAWPSPDHPSLVLDDPNKRHAIERAHARIQPMFWGRRLPSMRLATSSGRGCMLGARSRIDDCESSLGWLLPKAATCGPPSSPPKRRPS